MKIKLKQAFDLQMGKTPARNQAENWGGNHRWVSIADIGNAEKYIAKTKECITDAGINASGIKVVPQGTVIMSFKLSIGKTAITAQDMYTNEAIIAFIDKKIFEIDPNYLYHLCCGTDWTAGTNKAVMGLTLNKATLLEKEISLPDICQQRKIAAKLDKIDAIIADRQQQLTMIEQAVKSRFIELFGDLDLNSMDWVQKPLGEVCEQVKRYPTFCNMEYIQSGVRVIRIGNILIDGHIDTNDENYVFVYEDANNDYPDTVIEENDIIMAVRGDGSAAKRIGIVTEPKLFGANISPNLIRIKAKQELLVPLFLFYYLTGEVGQARLDAFVNKTAKKNIAAKDIVKVITPIPPIKLQRQFAAFVAQTDKSKLAVQQGLQELETLKKSLMQQYFG